VLNRIDNNTHVSAPDNKIAGLRLSYTFELAGPIVHCDGILVRIGKSGTLIDRVDKMRTITALRRMMTRFHGRAQNRKSLVQVKSLSRN
jgi:hypothetical protein